MADDDDDRGRFYLTERGSLLARLVHEKHGPGRYVVEGWDVENLHHAGDGGAPPWFVTRSFTDGPFEFGGRFDTFTQALQWIADHPD